jgi:hypothetical protein
LFDAICYLSLLAQGKLDEAARSIRSEDAKKGDIRSLFTKGATNHSGTIEFDADLIVPLSAYDQLRQEGLASTTFLNYQVKLGYRAIEADRRRIGELKLLAENLTYIPKSEVKKRLCFPSLDEWRDSVIKGNKRTK